jgi:hypothetical protein
MSLGLESSLSNLDSARSVDLTRNFRLLFFRKSVGFLKERSAFITVQLGVCILGSLMEGMGKGVC